MVTRRELHDLVWSKPMTKVAEGFGVSGSYMARVCLTLHVPCPPRGYWAKLAAGRAPAPTPLPDARPGDPEVWTKDERLLPRGMRKPSILRRKDVLRRDRPDRHPLLLGAREHYLNSRSEKDEEYLKPLKTKLPDITASRSALDRALGFANQLFFALEKAGFNVALAANHEPLQRAAIERREVPLGRKEQPGREYPTRWSPYQITRTYWGNTAIGLAIIEMMEEHEFRYVGGRYVREDTFPQSRSRNNTRDPWISRREVPSGRLRLVAYSPYRNTEYSREWQETRKKSLSTRISSIIRDIRLMVPEVEARQVEAIRQAEIWQRQWEIRMEKLRRDEDRRKSEQSVKESRTQLNDVIQKWSDTQGKIRFLEGVEMAASSLQESDRRAIMERLELAREFLGNQNPLEHFLKWRTPLELYKPEFAPDDLPGGS